MDNGKQHTVYLRKKVCSCRSWMLKGILCPHAICAMYYDNVEPIDFIDSCYNKETYLLTYSNLIQSLSNMPMWPESTNPSVAPPVVKSMSGRPKKIRRKETNEPKKSGKLPKIGLAMTCSLCHERGHNTRGCTKSERLGASSSTDAAKPSLSGNGKGRSKKSTTNEGDPTVKRGRGRPRKTTNVSTANAPDIAPSASIGAEFPSTSSLGSWFTCSALSSAPPDTTTNISVVAGISSTTGGRGRGRGRGGRSTIYHSLESWFSCSAPNASDIVSAASISSVAPSSSTATRGRGRGLGILTPYKRPRLMGMGVFQDENGFTTINDAK
nr:uncharacterized protein LOC104095696 isoform X2 [Nicotiana tomentosiformis]